MIKNYDYLINKQHLQSAACDVKLELDIEKISYSNLVVDKLFQIYSNRPNKSA